MRKLIVLVLAAISAAAVLGLSGAATAGGNGPRRNPSGGDWYKRVCAIAANSGACGAQVVTNSSGTPLAAIGVPPPSALGPTQFHTAYALPNNAPFVQTIGIVDAYDDPSIESDLAAYSAYYGLPACTTVNGCFRKVNQSGGTRYPSVNSGWALEIALDVETAHQICQNCNILLVEATSSSLANLGVAENTAASLGANVISNSWGAQEYSSETIDEASFFNHPGIAITASTGDLGYGVQFPASSRYVTAVGGTTLNLNANNTWQSETAWAGAGSGCSAFIPKPSWQTDSGCARRAVADVSADADPNTGAAVYNTVPYSGQTGWFQVGGTSLAAPLIAAVYALTGNASSDVAGSAPYGHTSSLHDVTSGNNGNCGGSYLCTARVGYDGPTGLGTPNGIGAFSPGGSPPPPPPGDFSVAVGPSSSTVTKGTNASYTITVTASGSFSGSVALSQSGLPNGAFAPSSISTSGTSTLTVNTTNVNAGTYQFTVTGTSGSTTHSATGTLVVSPSSTADFSVGVTPASQTVAQGTIVAYSTTVSAVGSFGGTVTLSQSGLPNGTFSPSSLVGFGTSSLLVNTSGMAPGTYAFTITGKSGATTHSVGATLIVSSGTPPDFSISVSPASRVIGSNSETTYTVTVTPLNGFSGSVSLSASGFGATLSGSFSPNPTPGSSTLTIDATNFRSGRSRTIITITGTSGSIQHSTTLALQSL